MEYVYRFKDNEDNIFKYIGIVWGKTRTLAQRINEHLKYDDWCQGKKWTIEYIEENINTRTDAEYFEAHFVSLYGTDKYYNKAKAGWGVSSFLPNRENDWVEYTQYNAATQDSNLECLYRVLFYDEYYNDKKDSRFKVDKVYAKKIICKTYKNVPNRNCPKCGNNIFYIRDDGFLYCEECRKKLWYTRKEKEYYTPYYNGQYENENYIYYFINQREAFMEKDLGSVISNSWYSGNKCIYVKDVDEITGAKIKIKDYFVNDLQNSIKKSQKDVDRIKSYINEYKIKLKKQTEIFNALLT